ncbi:MAG: acetate--CoA ligase family protein [Pseudomonadota bacterium]
MSSPPDLSRLLRPRSIAVLGGIWGERVVEQSLKMGFKGDIWPVSPTRSDMAGIAAVPSLNDLPAAPDATFIAVNRHAAVETVETLRQMGGGGGVCFASGFAETGAEGAALQQSLIDAAGPMPILGPNCYGLINYLDGALLWPDQHGGTRREKGVAILSQSGNIGINLTMNRRAVPLAYLGALGNQAQTTLAELTQALAQDDRVTAIGLYLEGLKDAAAFADAVAVAHEYNVPVAVLKAGRSAKGAELAVTHTGSLAGSDAVMDAYFKQIGAISVPSITTLLEALKILHLHGRLPGKSVTTMSCSGGEALLTADIAERTDLIFRPFKPEETARIKPTINPLVTLDNPFDYHTFDWGDWARAGATYEQVLACQFDMAALLLDFPRDDRCATDDWDGAIDAWRTATHATGARSAVLATLPELLPEAVAERLLADGIVPLYGLDDALTAIDACASTETRHAMPGFAGRSDLTAQVSTLSEHVAKSCLSDTSIPLPPGQLCASAADACRILQELGPPIVLKAVGADILHKTEIGGVRLNLTTNAEVQAAYDAIRELGTGVRVEKMAPPAVAELIVGMRRDPIVGLYLLLGSGGVAAELIRDTAILLPPASREMIRQTLLGLKLAPLMTGYRGRPVGDIDATVAAIDAIQTHVLGLGSEIEELEINPLLVHANGEGATAVDVLMRVRTPTTEAGRHIS